MLSFDPELGINLQPGFALSAQGEDCDPAILGERLGTLPSRLDLPPRNPDQPKYLSDLEVQSARDFPRPFAGGMAGKNLLSYRRIVDFPTRIPPNGGSDACRAQTSTRAILSMVAPRSRINKISGVALCTRPRGLPCNW